MTKPSVTYATKRLRENGYIEMDKDGLITLTDSGMQIAAKMLQRHHTLTNFLVDLGVDPETAEEDACKWSMTSATRRSGLFATMPESIWEPGRKQTSKVFAGRETWPETDAKANRPLTHCVRGRFL